MILPREWHVSFCYANVPFCLDRGMHPDVVLYNWYCPECSPGGTIVHPGEQLKKFLPFGLQRDLITLNATYL